MKTDLYAKTVLIAIALALVTLVMQHTSIISTANAKTNPIINYTSIPVNPDGSINVKFSKSDEVNVNIQGCNATLPINIEDCDRNAFRYAEPIEVKVETY